MFMFLILASLLYTVPATTYSDQLKVLKFTETGYILFTPDMSPFSNKMTVCTWLRDLGSPGCCPTVFNYGPVNRVRFDSDGGHLFMASQVCGYFQSELARVVTKGQWYHACLSWSTSSRSIRYYVNGNLLGSRGADSRTLSTGHNVAIGQHTTCINPFRNSNSFVGEVTKLNVYAKELAAEEIKRMYSGGLCGVEEDENEDVRVFKWENILKLSRTGPVSELIVAEKCLLGLRDLLEECERRLNETSAQLRESREMLENVKADLNTTLADKESLAEKLTETKLELNTTLTDKESLAENLAETKLELNTTMERLQEALERIEKLNRTWDWDLFTHADYINKTVFPETAKQMTSGWDDISGSRNILNSPFFYVLFSQNSPNLMTDHIRT